MIPGCTIIGTIVAKPETRAELQRILAALVAPTRAETGCLRYDFHFDASDPAFFVFYENWRSQADLDNHLTQPHLQTLFDRQGELLARPAEVRHLTMRSEAAD